jgi:hypothetical protein
MESQLTFRLLAEKDRTSEVISQLEKLEKRREYVLRVRLANSPTKEFGADTYVYSSDWNPKNYAVNLAGAGTNASVPSEYIHYYVNEVYTVSPGDNIPHGTYLVTPLCEVPHIVNIVDGVALTPNNHTGVVTLVAGVATVTTSKGVGITATRGVAAGTRGYDLDLSFVDVGPVRTWTITSMLTTGSTATSDTSTVYFSASSRSYGYVNLKVNNVTTCSYHYLSNGGFMRSEDAILTHNGAPLSIAISALTPCGDLRGSCGFKLVRQDV